MLTSCIYERTNSMTLIITKDGSILVNSSNAKSIDGVTTLKIDDETYIIRDGRIEMKKEKLKND